MSFNFVDGSGGFPILFAIVPIFIFIVFAIMIIMLLSKAIKYGVDKTKDVESVHAIVLSKRQQVWGERTHTYYFATFELTGGQRVEFSIPDSKIGYLVEGDEGTLTYQGKLFVGFSRQIQTASII
ncbi:MULTISPECIES: DUF2500 domain-containing protein [unclassified Fusibacter]|uniref:DUF2500 domain-containing protein n=1 Tax=unclassified Fusibacter TaxID=2624464 RepID=UPI0010112099|nr:MULTISPECIES: DUF2500 domain-containing protein [unclassified Fusibacter]MCK8058517.1 DUF2500 domain-containing protein [Fusibacter sp. A2]NPE22714.1 DUF2500 domain-containing protein [Fusibacter sp. A1]RXV60274.1 DUF2500 family protein [Fusibacter sp. A1]